MNPDQLRVKMCLSKKRMSHAEADSVAQKFIRNDGGRSKGKTRKRNAKMIAYHCAFCDGYHIGHDNFKGGYDPAKQFRDRYKAEETGGET